MKKAVFGIIFVANQSKITGIIVCIPNFGDEGGVVNFLKLSGLEVPILVQACSDDIENESRQQERFFLRQDMTDDEGVAQTVQFIKEYGKVSCEADPENVMKTDRLFLAVNRWMEENNCSAGAMQCWPSIQENYGCSACLTMSMLREIGKPMACEIDVTGALSMYALDLASGVPAGFLDWNNNYQAEKDLCVVIHCSNYTKSFLVVNLKHLMLIYWVKHLVAKNASELAKSR